MPGFQFNLTTIAGAIEQWTLRLGVASLEDTFLSEVGLARNRVQKTELDQFAPPTLRSKSRFMNLGTLFNWATMVLSGVTKIVPQLALECS